MLAGAAPRSAASSPQDHAWPRRAGRRRTRARPAGRATPVTDLGSWTWRSSARTMSRSCSARTRSRACKAIIAIHSTALGPALGGTRFYPYAERGRRRRRRPRPVPRDVLQEQPRRARPRRRQGRDHRRPAHRQDRGAAARLRPVRASRSAGATSPPATSAPTTPTWTSSPARRASSHGRSEAYGGCGDSSVLTAYGVFQGMRAAAQHTWGAPTLAGRTVAVAGVGKVGSWLVGHLVDDGADVVVTDVDPAAVDRLQARYPQVKAVADTAELVAHAARRLRAVRPRRRARRRDRRRAAGAGSSAAARTTSWPPRASPSSCATAASSTPPTTW